MGKAFEDALAVLAIRPRDQIRREAVARFIIHLAEIDGGVDAATMRDKVVVALGGATHVASSMSKDQETNAIGPKKARNAAPM